MQPILLTFQMEPVRLKQLRTAAKAMQIRIKNVPPEDYLQPVGRLAGLDYPAERQCYDGPPRPAEMLVMCHLTDSLTDRMLYALRQMGTVDYKAVLTPTNAGWSGLQLFLELHREHTQMQKG